MVTELTGDGQKQKGYVFAGDQLLAEQELNEVKWKYTTPLTGSTATAGVNSALTREPEFDPMGVSVGFGPTLWEPSEPLPESSELSLLGNSSGCGNNPNCTRCSMDGMQIGCDQAQHLMEVGVAEYQSFATVRVSIHGLTQTFTGMVNLPAGLNLRFTGLEDTGFDNGRPNRLAPGGFTEGVREYPQTATFNVPGIRDAVNAVLNNADCAAFVSTILNAVSTKSNPVYPDGGGMGDVFWCFSQPK